MGAVLVISFHTEAELQGVVQPTGNAGGYWVVFLFERRITVYRLVRAEQVEPLPYNHHLQEFLTSLKRERFRRCHDC